MPTLLDISEFQNSKSMEVNKMQNHHGVPEQKLTWALGNTFLKISNHTFALIRHVTFSCLETAKCGSSTKSEPTVSNGDARFARINVLPQTKHFEPTCNLNTRS